MNTISFILLTASIVITLRLAYCLVTFLFHWNIKRVFIKSFLLAVCLGIFFILNEQYAINDYNIILVNYKDILIVYLKELIIFVKSLNK